jgi:predicted amidohydrolase
MIRRPTSALLPLLVLAAGAGLPLDPPRGAGADGEPVAPPTGWRFSAPRDEIAARSWVERGAPGVPADFALGLGGKGSDAVDGRWERTVPLAPGRHHAFRARCRIQRVESPERSVLARVVWLAADGRQVEQPEYPAPLPTAPDGWTPIAGTWLPPAGAASARLELHFRWSAAGEVLWRDIELAPAEPPRARKVRIAAVNHRPRGAQSPRANLERFAALVGEAAGARADIACLPEGITVCGTGKSCAEVAEPIPGPATEVLGAAAAKHGVAVVAGIYERDGAAVYNTSILLGKDGKLAGKYRKVCLPREEIDGGLTPGKEYPVFDAGFGKVGMMICWDVHFPGVARELAARGAEVIFLPIWGGNETLARARAIENQVHLVASGYDFGTAIYDRRGEPIARAAKDPEVIVVEIDLGERVLWPWLGDWRARIRSEAPAEGRTP